MYFKNTGYLKEWAELNAIALVLGIFAGLGAIIFGKMIEFSKHFFEIVFQRGFFGALSIIIIPAIGGAIVGPIIYKYCSESKGHGIPEVIYAVKAKNSNIRKRVAFFKTIVSSITIGSGGSAGREGPIAQIGASMGSTFGQFFKFDERKKRILVVSGLSSGVAAAFNAPLGGTIFGLELILADFSPISVIPIALSSVISVSIARTVLGPESAINAASFAFNPAEIPFYMLLGAIMGIVSFFYIKAFYFFEDSFDKMKIPFYIKPAIGGFLTGLVGFSFVGYGVLGGGFEGINAALAGQIGLTLLILLFCAKFLATSFTLGSGASGGIFSPSLYLGAMLGGALGIIFRGFAPNVVGSPSAYALIGMGAFFASVAKVPLTCIIMIPEMSSDYSMIPTLMLSVFVSYGFSALFLGRSSIYMEKLNKRISTVKSFSKDLTDVTAKDIMTEEIISMDPDMPLTNFWNYVKKYKKLGFPVIKDGELLGTISNNKVKNIDSKKIPFLKVMDAMSPPTYVFPYDDVPKILGIMGERKCGRVLVLDPITKEIYGIITKSDLLKAYRIAKNRGDDEDRFKISEEFEREVSTVSHKLYDKIKWPK
ncbi:MAG: chloride channel protein [Candidatus Methanofastidiosum sp.]|nr:chloride channel protein [Methanofastidiosum sp.]